MATLNHNKRMNAGLLYEFLLRELAAATISEDTIRAADVLGLVRDSFGPGTALSDELAIHTTALENRGLSRSLAQRLVDEIRLAAVRLDRRSSDLMKRRLLGEMRKLFGDDVLDRHVIPEYKAHASIGILIQSTGRRRIDEAADLARVEEYLVSFISSREPAQKRVEPEASTLAYRIAVESYESEYGKLLDSQQSELLREHVRVSLGGKPVGAAKMIERHRKSILEALKKAPLMEGVGTDSEMVKRLKEARRELESLPNDVTAETFERLMLFHDLRREIES